MWDESKNASVEREELARLEKEQEAYSRMEEARHVTQSEEGKTELKRKRNVRYYVDGERVTPRKAACVQEDGSYMADFICGKGGKIEEIHYDRIKPR